jgi:thiamine kinase-like enzyme
MQPQERARRLSLWREPVEPVPLPGGITNTNFLVRHQGQRLVVRIGDDIPVHGVMRFNEHAAARAAHAAGLSPEIVHAEPGALVMRHIEGRTLTPEDVRDPANLARIAALVRRCHLELPRHLRGPLLAFWVFHVLRGYAHTLVEGGSRHRPLLADLIGRAEALEQAVGPVDLVFAHNDLLAANLIDDGKRLWLLDWDYAGFNDRLFDPANLATNNDLGREEEQALLRAYLGRAPDGRIWRRFRAFAAASTLREAMWSMVSELHSRLDFDYAAYTADNLARFERAHAAFLGD